MKYYQNLKLCHRNFSAKIDELTKKLKFDTNTYIHCLNVAACSAYFLEYTDFRIDKSLIYYAGLFHDVGKTKIDIQILQKEGSLNKDELKLIKNHPSLGLAILSKYGAPEEISLAAQFHHERNNGTGYPSGLSGNLIPPVAKIISICDVFNALVSDRPYRKAYSFEEALQIMRNSSEQFDSKLLSAFLDNIGGFRIITSLPQT